jgi:hypothetical protein
MLLIRMKKKRPLNNQKEGKKTFRPTIGWMIPRSIPMHSSMISCPREGIRLGLPTSHLTRRIKTTETTQLVTIELVIGRSPKTFNLCAVTLTPSSAEHKELAKSKMIGVR